MTTSLFLRSLNLGVQFGFLVWLWRNSPFCRAVINGVLLCYAIMEVWRCR